MVLISFKFQPKVVKRHFKIAKIKMTVNVKHPAMLCNKNFKTTIIHESFALEQNS